MAPKMEELTKNIIEEDKGLPHEEHVMSLMYVNHKELFERKHFPYRTATF